MISQRYLCVRPVSSIGLAISLSLCGMASAQTQLPIMGEVPPAEVRPPPPPRAWQVERYIRATVTATDNSGLSTAAQVPKDVILDLEPRLVVKGRGANYTLNADVAAHVLVYTDNSQDGRILPVGTVALNGVLIDRWLYVDTSVTADQISPDPYAFRTDIDTGRNKINTLGYRLSPYVKHDFSPSVSLLARSDNYWTYRRGEFADRDPRRNSLVERQSAVLERRPIPFGFSAEASSEVTSYRTGILETVLKLDAARAVATYAVDPTFTVGLVGGTERSEFALTSTTDQIAGGRINWAPSERTSLSGTLEKRFFGKGGTLQISHRSPFIGLSLSAAREPTATGSSFIVNPGEGSTQSLLDAIFTTRYPDPAQRAIVVNSVISGLGVPNVLGEPLEVFSGYAQLRDSVNAAVIFQGRRSTVLARVYAVRLRQLNRENSPFIPGVTLQADNFQRGASIDFSRKITTTYTADLSIGFADIEGRGLALGQTTKNKNLRVTLAQELSPRTKFNYGLRYQVDDIVDPTVNRTVKETAAFLGVIHRF